MSVYGGFAVTFADTDDLVWSRTAKEPTEVLGAATALAVWDITSPTTIDGLVIESSDDEVSDDEVTRIRDDISMSLDLQAIPRPRIAHIVVLDSPQRAPAVLDDAGPTDVRVGLVPSATRQCWSKTRACKA